MLSKRCVNPTSFVALLLVAVFAQAERADVVVGEDSTIYGKVLGMDRDSVLIARRCNRNNVANVARARVRAVIIDAECGPHQFTMPTAGLSPCEQNKVPIHKVYFAGLDSVVYATNSLIGGDGVAHFTLADGSTLHGPLTNVRLIWNDFVCPTRLTTPQSVPSGFCHDQPRWAVNWRPEPVHRNTIFTRGFSFYLENVGDAPGPTPAEIERAFGSALTLWTSLLLKHRAKLDPALRGYVDSILGRSESATLLVPPQVVNVNCKANASMIVKLYGRRQPVFPDDEYVAKAQMRGRTIMLNGIDYKLKYDLTMREMSGGGVVNLTAVFAHELGHAFGLGHVSGVPSVMSADNPVGAPTDNDATRFIAVLRESVVGSRPGEFDPTSCAGLRLKPAGRRAAGRPAARRK